MFNTADTKLTFVIVQVAVGVNYLQVGRTYIVADSKLAIIVSSHHDEPTQQAGWLLLLNMSEELAGCSGPVAGVQLCIEACW